MNPEARTQCTRLQGALLLGLFNISHVVETSLSRRAQGDLASLYDQIPSTAVVVDLLPSGAPDMSTAATQLASEVLVGAHMLVRPGQQVSCAGCEQDTDDSLMPALQTASVILYLQLTCHGEFAMGCVGLAGKDRKHWQEGHGNMAWHSLSGMAVLCVIQSAGHSSRAWTAVSPRLYPWLRDPVRMHAWGLLSSSA